MLVFIYFFTSTILEVFITPNLVFKFEYELKGHVLAFCL